MRRIVGRQQYDFLHFVERKQTLDHIDMFSVYGVECSAEYYFQTCHIDIVHKIDDFSNNIVAQGGIYSTKRAIIAVWQFYSILYF